VPVRHVVEQGDAAEILQQHQHADRHRLAAREFLRVIEDFGRGGSPHTDDILEHHTTSEHVSAQGLAAATDQIIAFAKQRERKVKLSRSRKLHLPSLLFGRRYFLAFATGHGQPDCNRLLAALDLSATAGLQRAALLCIAPSTSFAALLAYRGIASPFRSGFHDDLDAPVLAVANFL
jgi:hypothetical protein